MVITMQKTWHTKYTNVKEFLSFFENEQDYVDAMFVQIVMFNFGVYHDASTLRHEDQERIEDRR